MPSADESPLVLCEWPVTVYVPADLPPDQALALVEVAESQLGVYAAALEAFLQRHVTAVRVEIG